MYSNSSFLTFASKVLFGSAKYFGTKVAESLFSFGLGLSVLVEQAVMVKMSGMIKNFNTKDVSINGC